MRAVLLTGFGGPEKLSYREDVPVPKPGLGEVLIQVGATGVNNTDIWTREGAYGLEDETGAISGWKRDQSFVFPRIQGADIAGQIVAVGPGMDGARIGTRVLVNPTLYGPGEDDFLYTGFIGSEQDGGFAEYVALPAANAHEIHTPLTDAELATFPTAYLTAEHMLNQANLTRGETVLITGASGGVGSALVQLARLREARVLAIVGAGKEEPLHELGAQVVFTRQVENLFEEITKASGIRGIDVVADVVGGGMINYLLNLLKERGRYVTAGAIAGPIVQLDLRTLYLNQKTLIGSTLGSQEEFEGLVSQIESGRLKPLLAGSYPLHEISKAHVDFKAKQFFGKLVIIP